MSNKSMLDVAYEVVKENNGSVPFTKIWQAIVTELGFDDETARNKISSFYTILSLDSRFHNMGDNSWELCSNLTFDQINADIDFSIQESEEDDVIDEDEEDLIIDEDEEKELDEEESEEDDDEDKVVEEDE